MSNLKYLAMIVSFIMFSKCVNCDGMIKLPTRKIVIRRASLVHHWSFDSHLNDEIAGAKMSQGFSACLTADRFDRPLSALSLKSGYYKLETRNYLPNGHFTVMAWIYLRAYNFGSKFFDFYQAPQLDSVSSGFEYAGVSVHFLCNETRCAGALSNKLPLNKWAHVSITYQNKRVNYYINGVIDTSTSIIVAPQIMTRAFNYLGKSNSVSDQNANAIIDDFKIFKEALNQLEIKQEID